VILSEDTEPPLESPPPPFLQEPGYLVDQQAEPSFLTRAAETFDRWRPGVLLVFTPLVVAAIGLAYFNRHDTGPADGATVTSGDDSAVQPLIDGVTSDSDGSTDTSAGPTIVARPSSTTSITAPPPTVSLAPAPTAPTTASTVVETTAVETTAAVATTTPGATTQPTEATTTTEATTQPAPPAVCTATVRRSATLRSEPNPFSQQVGQVSSGDYPLLATETVRIFFRRFRWYQIDAGGTVGWLEDGDVSGTQNC
jgi:hypothetical protein